MKTYLIDGLLLVTRIRKNSNGTVLVFEVGAPSLPFLVASSRLYLPRERDRSYKGSYKNKFWKHLTKTV